MFLIEAVMLAGLGGFVGLVVGLGGVHLLTWLYPAVPANPPAWAMVGALGVAMILGGLFGVVPARRAAKLDPIMALQRR